MHPSLDKKTVLRSLRSLAFVLAICLIVWLWGNNHKVDVELEFLLELKGAPQAQTIDLTFYQNEKAMQEMTLSVAAQSNRSNAHTSLKPGKYELRGMIRTADGQNHVVEQTIYVPEDDAQVTVYLRN